MSTVTQPAALRQRPGTSAMFSLLLVFLAGVAVGALAMSLGIHNTLHRSASAWTENGHAITLDKWKKELDLNDDQSKQIEMVLDDFSKYYDNVLADGNSRILQILDDRQKIKFERMLKDHR
jgi:uncharacterized membrane-anchored protein YhcB (DUF1043 family)